MTDFEYRITVYPNHAIIEGPIEVHAWVDIINLLRKHEGFMLITHNEGDGYKLGCKLVRDNEIHEYDYFLNWIANQKYKMVVFIAGNHDRLIEEYWKPAKEPIDGLKFDFETRYLCDSSTKFEGLKIWGSPWTKTFPGMNPDCSAFTCDTEEELAEKWALIPDNTEILITHSPPHGILDKTIDGKSVGSKSLALKIGSMINPPKLWVWGHIHEAYGQDKAIRQKPCIMVNASHVNENYKPVNKPIRIEL